MNRKIVTPSLIALFAITIFACIPAAASATVPSLTSGVATTGSISTPGGTQVYRIYVPGGCDKMTTTVDNMTTTAGSSLIGNFEFYGQVEREPTPESFAWHWDSSSESGGSYDCKNPTSGTWYIMVKSKSLPGFFTIRCTLAFLSLTTGVAKTGAISTPGGTHMYQITVPGGSTQMITAVSHPAGTDFDTYGQVGALPTQMSYAWEGYTEDNPEVVTVPDPAAGTWYIMVHAYAGTGSFVINCTLTFPVLTSGVETTGSINARGADQTYLITVPGGCTQMETSLSHPLDANFDLYGRLASYTGFAKWHGTSARNPEEVTFYDPRAGSWYVQVRSAAGTGPFSVTCTLSFVSLTSGVVTTGEISKPGGTYLCQITVPGECTQMVTSVSHPAGTDFDVYGRVGLQPTPDSCDWFGNSTSNPDLVTFASPAAGTWFIMVRSRSGAGSFVINCTLSTFPVLTSGVAMMDSIDTAGGTKMYRIAVPGGCTQMVTSVSFPEGADFDLYGKLGAQPTPESYAWRGYTEDNPEMVFFVNPRAGTWYIMVHAYAGTGSFTIQCLLTFGILEDGIAKRGSILTLGGNQTYQITVPSGCTQMVTSVSPPDGADFDSYGQDGAPPSPASYAWRGYTGNTPETVTYNNPVAGTWYIMVTSFAGTGSFAITCSLSFFTLTSGVATAGSIGTPGGNQTYRIAVPGGCTQMVTSVSVPEGADFDLYGKLGAQPTPESYAWRGYTEDNPEKVFFVNPRAGTWYIMVHAYAGAGSFEINCTLTFPILTSGVATTGSISTPGGSYLCQVTVPSGCSQMVTTVSPPAGADLELYGQVGAFPSPSDFAWHGNTTINPEGVTFASPTAGTWYIMVKSGAGTGSFAITCTLDHGFKIGQLRNKYAVIAAISTYKAIDPLEYCDEDATDWYYYLVNEMGYPAENIRVLGDGSKTSSYPVKPYGVATEANYKACLTWLAGQTGAEIAFITGGHGFGDYQGESLICAWDYGSGESREDGSFYDHEIAAILEKSTAASIFVFIDHCLSGGIIPEIANMSNAARVYCATTCTEAGYGYDVLDYEHGAWTYWFLELGLEAHFNNSTATAMEDCFAYSVPTYMDLIFSVEGTVADTPMQFDGNP
jgi:hypothetical protein